MDSWLNVLRRKDSRWFHIEGSLLIGRTRDLHVSLLQVVGLDPIGKLFDGKALHVDYVFPVLIHPVEDTDADQSSGWIEGSQPKDNLLQHFINIASRSQCVPSLV